MKKEPQKKPAESLGIGYLLVQSLTTTQIERLLDVVFLKGEPDRYADEFRKSSIPGLLV